MNSREHQTCASITAVFPPLKPARPETADRGALRYGDCSITAVFPPLKPARPETADRGALRYGDCSITAVFPPRR